MSIEITCECGKRFRAKGEYAGRRGICPACRREFVVSVPVELELIEPKFSSKPDAATIPGLDVKIDLT